jgi:hypothetical protein
MADVSEDFTGAAQAKRAALASRAGQRVKGLRWWRCLMVAAVFGLGLLQAFNYTISAKQEAPASADCLRWDSEASEGIAGLIFDRSPSAEIRLDEAIQQLRRARKYCRTGSVAVAGHDYASLRRAFPIKTGSVKQTSDADTNSPRLNGGR